MNWNINKKKNMKKLLKKDMKILKRTIIILRIFLYEKVLIDVN